MTLSTPARAILGAILVAVNIVNPFLDVSSTAHVAIGLVSTAFLAIGITSNAALSVVKLLPHEVVTALGLAAAIGQAFIQDPHANDLSDPAKAVIGGVLAFLVGIGITPSTLATTPAAQSVPR